MSSPEFGMCTTDVYEKGKRFMVAPDRLCVNGIYTFACKAPPNVDWQACLFTSRVESVKESENTGYSHLVSVAFEELDRPNVFDQASIYPVTESGLVLPVSEKIVYEEAYLKHHFGSVEDKFAHIDELAPAPPIVVDTPSILPIQFV